MQQQRLSGADLWQTCGCSTAPLFMGARYGGGVDRQHAAVAGCLADVTHSHSGTKVYIEQPIPALTRAVSGQIEHARMYLVFDQNDTTTYLDVAIVCPFSTSPAFIAAASTRPGHVDGGAEKVKIDRYTRTCQSCPVHPGDHRPPWTPRQESSSATS